VTTQQPEPEAGDAIYRPDAQPWDPAHYPYAGYPAPGPYAYAPPGYAPAGYGQPGYAAAGYPQVGYPYGGYPPAPAPAPKRGRRRAVVAVGVGAVAAATVVGVAVASGTTQAISGSAIAAGGSVGTSGGTSGGATTPTLPTLPTLPVTPGSGTDPYPRGNWGNGGNSGTGSSTGAKASAAQSVGVVDIETVQDFGTSAAAGTGMVLTSDGEILTNNHVIDHATAIKATVVSTGKTYTAKVVGTSPTKDIAVIQLQNASGLKTINLGDSSTVSVGDAVTGVGNAGGTGGTPSAAAGKVTALNRTITASDEDGSGAETLHDVIVTDAPIQAGDSGGPLYNAKDRVVGIDTAASTSGRSVGFAIPINTALSIAQQIEKGVRTSSIHIGYPGFLGITVSSTPGAGATVAGVLSGGPAAKAGLAEGDLITRIGSTTVANATQLQKAIAAHQPGSKVSVTYTDPNTGKHTVTVTLATGPAD